MTGGAPKWAGAPLGWAEAAGGASNEATIHWGGVRWNCRGGAMRLGPRSPLADPPYVATIRLRSVLEFVVARRVVGPASVVKVRSLWGHVREGEGRAVGPH